MTAIKTEVLVMELSSVNYFFITLNNCDMNKNSDFKQHKDESALMPIFTLSENKIQNALRLIELAARSEASGAVSGNAARAKKHLSKKR
ncbi:jg2267 [Pararge aegeria aegeria]|uniref:Jg2267 protein n=1 Tax=Pararge aegeria aegeria TaxID=348720 RepID=A0A8S4RRI4_9NEOP|nr:jg2267 [Pararge aegeria aegeria]